MECCSKRIEYLQKRLKRFLNLAVFLIEKKNKEKFAVIRNLLRRRGYSALQKNIKLSPFGLLGVFIFKKYQDDILMLENEIKNIFSKIN